MNQNKIIFMMTATPWISFTSVMHPICIQPGDSIPRIAWGKYMDEGGKLRMPLSFQVDHALMDGLHVGRYIQEVERQFANAGDLLGQGS